MAQKKMKCNLCKKIKEPTEFPPLNVYGKSDTCKECYLIPYYDWVYAIELRRKEKS
jgi:hypothetical protein